MSGTNRGGGRRQIRRFGGEFECFLTALATKRAGLLEIARPEGDQRWTRVIGRSTLGPTSKTCWLELKVSFGMLPSGYGGPPSSGRGVLFFSASIVWATLSSIANARDVAALVQELTSWAWSALSIIAQAVGM